MTQTIIIRGPAGVGKTTVARLLAKKLKLKHIQIDKLLKEKNLDKIFIYKTEHLKGKIGKYIYGDRGVVGLHLPGTYPDTSAGMLHIGKLQNILKRPRGTLGKLYSVEGDIFATFRHEFGHHVRSSLPFERHIQWEEIYKSQPRSFWNESISTYGAQNSSELFAESFTYYTSPIYKSGKFDLTTSIIKGFAIVTESTPYDINSLIKETNSFLNFLSNS